MVLLRCQGSFNAQSRYLAVRSDREVRMRPFMARDEHFYTSRDIIWRVWTLSVRGPRWE